MSYNYFCSVLRNRKAILIVLRREAGVGVQITQRLSVWDATLFFYFIAVSSLHCTAIP
jgi:hypothetical protein